MDVGHLYREGWHSIKKIVLKGNTGMHPSGIYIMEVGVQLKKNSNEK